MDECDHGLRGVSTRAVQRRPCPAAHDCARWRGVSHFDRARERVAAIVQHGAEPRHDLRRAENARDGFGFDDETVAGEGRDSNRDGRMVGERQRPCPVRSVVRQDIPQREAVVWSERHRAFPTAREILNRAAVGGLNARGFGGGEAVLAQPRAELGVVLQVTDVGIVLGRRDAVHDVAASGLLDEVRHRAPGSVAIDEVGDVPAREGGVHGEHAADPVCVQDVEILGARLALNRRECGDVLGPELSLHGRKVAADPAGLGRTKVDVGSDEQQGHRKREREHGSSLS